MASIVLSPVTPGEQRVGAVLGQGHGKGSAGFLPPTVGGGGVGL